MSAADERIAKLIESGIAKLDGLERRIESLERLVKRSRSSVDVPTGKPPSGHSDSGRAHGALGEAVTRSASSAKGSAGAVSAAPTTAAKRASAAAGRRHRDGEQSGSGDEALSGDAEGHEAMEDSLSEEASNRPLTFTCHPKPARLEEIRFHDLFTIVLQPREGPPQGHGAHKL